MNRVKLLSPAGSFESLQAAIQGGASGIYFGIEQLNMRARSSNNFTLEDLSRIVELCSSSRPALPNQLQPAVPIKTYLTLNTIIYDHDISLIKRIIRAAKESGVNAII